jgi:hypothetical protein
MTKERKRKIRKFKNMNLWCESEDGIELVKVPVAYSKEFIQRFGTESIPERRDLLDWLYEKKNSK